MKLDVRMPRMWSAKLIILARPFTTTGCFVFRLQPKRSVCRAVIGLCGVLISAAPGLRAQSVQPSSSVVSRGGSSSFRIEWTASADKPVVALQWSFRVPEGVRIAPDDIAAGSAAESAQKTITCSKTGKTTDLPSGFTCIIAGGEKPISGGPVAVVLYSIPATMSRGTIPVLIEKAIGVKADLTRLPIADAQNTITIK